MGLFADAGSADPAGSRNNPKPGKYWIILNLSAKDVSKNPKKGKAGKEFMKVLTTVIRAFDGAGCRSHGVTASGTANPLCGKGHVPGEACDWIFMDGVQGNAGRMKDFAMKVCDTTDKNAVDAAAFEAMCSNIQPTKDVILEVSVAQEAILTQSSVWIHPGQADRRVYHDEVLRDWNSLSEVARVELQKEGRWDRLVAKEKKLLERRAERAKLASPAATATT